MRSRHLTIGKWHGSKVLLSGRKAQGQCAEDNNEVRRNHCHLRPAAPPVMNPLTSTTAQICGKEEVMISNQGIRSPLSTIQPSTSHGSRSTTTDNGKCQQTGERDSSKTLPSPELTEGRDSSKQCTLQSCQRPQSQLQHVQLPPLCPP